MPFDSANVEHLSTTLGVLLRARQRVAAGWMQGKLHSDHAFCAIGGIREDAAKGLRSDAAAYLYAALPWWYRYRPTVGWSNLTNAESHVAAYNDSRGRTRKQIIALYERAISLCREDMSDNA